jgi:hypothetical protein
MTSTARRNPKTACQTLLLAGALVPLGMTQTSGPKDFAAVDDYITRADADHAVSRHLPWDHPKEQGGVFQRYGKAGPDGQSLKLPGDDVS